MPYSHKAKNIISIRDFRVGERTYGDTEASDAQGKFSKIQNVETDKAGMLYKRDPAKYLGTTDTVISQFQKWYNSKLTAESWNGENNESCWIGFGTNGGSDKISLWNATTFAWEANLATLGGDGGTCRILPFANDIRFINGLTRNVSIWAYNYDLKFFNGEFTTTAGFNYGQAHLGQPATWQHSAISLDDYGMLPDGYYYYKVVGVYDGVQEMELPDDYGFIFASNDLGNTISFLYNMDTSDFDKRIKALKIYRGYAKQNIEVVYNHIKTIPINTTTGDIGQTQAFSGMRGADTSTTMILIDKDINFTSFLTFPLSGVDDYVCKWRDTTGEEVTASVISCGDGWCEIYWAGGIDNRHRMWLNKYSIHAEIDSARSFNQVIGGDNGCIGDNILWDDGASWKNSQFTNWTLPVTGGNTITILGNYGNIFRLSGGHGIAISGSIGGTATEVGAYFSESAGTVTMQFIDTGYPNGASHPLDGITKTKVRSKYGALHNGRMFYWNIALDPDDENEIHENWMAYSEFNQYDTVPVSNVIPLVDPRGGQGTGIVSAGGYLVAFTETGVFRVNVPSVDPYGWRTEQAITDMGCTAPDSIIEAEGIVFFANATGIWALTPHDFQKYEITYDIKDQYLDASNHENTRITYDVKKRRLVCRFGDVEATQHIFDIEAFLSGNRTLWSRQVYDQNSTTQHSAPSLTVIDENQLFYGLSYWTNTGVPSTGFSQLYGHASGAETLQCIITTPWLSIEDIDFNIIWRRLNLVLKQLADATNNDLENITINVYQDKFDTIDSTHGSTHTFSANAEDYTSLMVTEEVIRLAMRSTFIKIEIITTKTTSNDFELHRLEVILDD